MFNGYYVAIVTPFSEDRIDFDAYRREIDWVIDNGVNGIITCGTTGESMSLSTSEKNELVKTTVEYARKRVPVIVGVAAVSTWEVLSQMDQAQQHNIDGIMALCPCYIKPTQEGLFLHFKAVSENTNLPVVIYNNPGRTIVDIDLNTLERLMVYENISAIKECSTDLQRFSLWKQRLKPNFKMMSGNDDTAAGALAMGADGVVSVAANVAPRYCSELYKCWENKDYEGFEKRMQRLAPLYKALFCESNPIPVKYAMHLLGLIKNEIRSPLTVLTEANRAVVRRAMQNLGLVI